MQRSSRMRGWTSPKRRASIIVPDDVLWYLPFEVLVPDAANAEKVLADRVSDSVRTDGRAGDLATRGRCAGRSKRASSPTT